MVYIIPCISGRSLKICTVISYPPWTELSFISYFQMSSSFTPCLLMPSQNPCCFRKLAGEQESSTKASLDFPLVNKRSTHFSTPVSSSTMTPDTLGKSKYPFTITIGTLGRCFLMLSRTASVSNMEPMRITPSTRRCSKIRM